jgi:hypothetical protein
MTICHTNNLAMSKNSGTFRVVLGRGMRFAVNGTYKNPIYIRSKLPLTVCHV